MPVIEDFARREQLKGNLDLSYSFSLRPIVNTNITHFGSASIDSIPWSLPILSEKRDWLKLSLLPIQSRYIYNSHHPYGSNDGAMIRARGVQSLLSGGLDGKIGPLSFQFRPEWVIAQNKNYEGFPETYSPNVWRIYYSSILNRIDLPEQMGKSSYYSLFPGQTGLFLDAGFNRIGISTENIWLGPGKMNSLVFSSNAAGMLHYKITSKRPVNIKVGHIEYLIMVGNPKSTGLAPIRHDSTNLDFFSPQRSDKRYLTGMMFAYSPSFVNGLSFGIVRTVQNYASDLQKNYFSSFTGFFRNDGIYDRADQLASLFARWVFTDAQAELYFELARNDASYNIRDLLLGPEHSRAYVFGFSKLFLYNNHTYQFSFENTHLERSGMYYFRAEPIYYLNAGLRHGHTHNGEIIGSGIGPGSNFNYISLKKTNNLNSFGVVFEKLDHNKDIYKILFPNSSVSRNWIETSVGFEGSYLWKNILMESKLLVNHSKNYQWQQNQFPDIALNGKSENRNNVNFSLNAVYVFTQK